MPSKRFRRGFTWIELIVIVVIFAVILGLLIPAIMAARETSRKQTCMNNLKQIGMGLHTYHDARRCFPGSAQIVQNGSKRKAGGWSFLFQILPGKYGSGSPANEIPPVLIKNTISSDEKSFVDPLTDMDKAIRKTRDWHIAEFLCPSNSNKVYEDPANKKTAFTNYKAMGATCMESLRLSVDPDSSPPYGDKKTHPDGGLFPGNSGIRIQDIQDGTALTIMIAETIDDTKSSWIAGSDVTLVGMPRATSYRLSENNIYIAPMDFNGYFGELASPAIQAMRTYLAFDFRPGCSDAGTYPTSIGRTPAYGPSSGHCKIVNHLLFDGSVKSLKKDCDYVAYFFALTRDNNDPSPFEDTL